MKRNFTFKSYIVYVFRYWLILAVCAIIGLGAGIGYGIFTANNDKIVYRGSIAVGGLSVFVDDLQEITENPSSAYNTIKSEAFAAMQSEWVLEELYARKQSEWRNIGKNGKLGSVDLRKEFFDALSLWDSGYIVYISFEQDKDEFIEQRKAFAKDVVDTCLNISRSQALIHEPMLGKENRLMVVNAIEKTVGGDKSVGILRGGFIGAAVAVALELLAMFAAFFADRRILGYADIASVAGGRLYGVCGGAVTGKICPKIDSDLGDDRILLICGDEDASRRLAELYGEYAAEAGNRTLRIDFSRTDGETADTFGEYMSGKKLADCIADENGADVLRGNQSWATVLKNSDKVSGLSETYRRVVVCAPYRDNGSLNVLGRVSDKIIFALNQSRQRASDIDGMASEIYDNKKTLGAVIEYAGKSFVGGSTYSATQEEDY